MSSIEENTRPPIVGEAGPQVPTIQAIRIEQETGALVIGGDYRGLGVVRSLGRRGIPTWVLTDEHLIAATSRYCRRSLPGPTGDAAQRLQYLLDLADKHQLHGWTVYPTGDDTAAFVARHHEQLSTHFLLTTPPWETVQWTHDKRLTHVLAARLELDQPWIYSPASRDDLATVDCPFPVILKPAVKEEVNAFTHAKAWRVDSREELLARYEEASLLVAPETIMLQELIPGGGECQFSFAALCSTGVPLASITARRRRQYPVDFGRSSSYVETIELPELEEVARRLLADIRFEGLVEVEFKRDPRDGRFKLLDINPRVWGWHTLGFRAGADFSFLQWQLVHGEPVAEVRARPGVRWVRALTDVPAVLEEIRRRRLSLGGYLRSLSGPMEYAILAADDPLPALLEVPLASRIALRRGRV